MTSVATPPPQANGLHKKAPNVLFMNGTGKAAVPNGAPNGAPNGVPNGAPNGVPNGAPNGVPNGVPKGIPNGKVKPVITATHEEIYGRAPEVITKIDDRDANTPDKWIPRHPDLVRLTGKHPFNCEPPLTKLMEDGFITTTPLHYVRNHGAAPKLDWDSHRLEVEGLVPKKLCLTMEDIVRLPCREIPVTLVCAGNRRKEQNMIKQSIGFNWGAAAVSTSVWKGVPVREVLKLAGLAGNADDEEPRYVWFHGCEPLPNGYYGTSLTFDWAFSDSADVLLAYEQNGKRLTTDHGYPLRVIIPGAIGGRMIKWLTKITVSDRENDSHYHYHDNRVLPPDVDAERATKEGWWYVPEYIINELNINSAITSPAHDEILPLSSFVSTGEYTIKGYAYTGGGRKVVRVEVTLDDGKTWLLTKVSYPELDHPLVKARSHKPNRRYWCWVFWEISVPLLSFLRCPEIAVRAWDAAQNTQPAHPTWNVMGMMNNPHFRVKLHTITRGKDVALMFEHPTQPGNQPGGWLVRQKQQEQLQQPPPLKRKQTAPTLTTTKPNKVYTMDQVAKHDDDKDCWIVVNKKVYDCTPFLEEHPGGADSITINAGTDCTEEFNAIHSDKAKAMLDDYFVGDLAEASPEVSFASSPTSSPTSSPQGTPRSEMPPPHVMAGPADMPVALNPKKWLSCPLISRKEISHDTRVLRFGLPSEKHQLGLPVGQHIFIRSKVDDHPVIRAYTPISAPGDALGHFDLLVKVYFKCPPKFPNGGLMSQQLDSLVLGDTIDIKGPLGAFIYNGCGQYVVKHGLKADIRNCTHIGLIAGGSGLTPCYQVIQAILRDPKDSTRVSLIYANRSEQDILMHNELDELAAQDPRFDVWYTIDVSQPDWKYDVGFITEQMIRTRLPAPNNGNTIVLMCGPPPMIEFACIPNLKKIGFKENDFHKF